MSNIEEIKAQDMVQVESNSNKVDHNPIVLCGPSGVGKGTLTSLLFKDWGDVIAKKVSHTTRPPRQGEINGEHYHFTTTEEFEKGIAEGKFIEHAKVHTNYYGTAFESVQSARAKGHIVLLELDIQGVRTVREKTKTNPEAGLPCTYVFISPPNEEELYSRLKGRGTDSEDVIQTRLETARAELDAAKHEPELFDHMLVNENLDVCYENLNVLIGQLFPHLSERVEIVRARLQLERNATASPNTPINQSE